MRISQYRPSKQATYAGLMALSTLAILLPPRLTDGTKHGTQLLVPLQHVAYALTFKSLNALEAARRQDAPAAPAAAALQNIIASQAVKIEQLEEEKARMGQIRTRARTRALQAQIVARDLVAWRDTVLVDRGSEGKVRKRDWVASRFFIDQGDLSDVQQGSAVIAKDVLLGRVEMVSPYMSRVQLFSDLDFKGIEVRIGDYVQGGFKLVDHANMLIGLGDGRMGIENVDYRVVQLPHEAPPDDGVVRIAIGSWVCSAPGTLGLPEPMVIGRVAAIEEDRRQRLVHKLIVEPALAIDDVRYVHVIPLLSTEIPM